MRAVFDSSKGKLSSWALGGHSPSIYLGTKLGVLGQPSPGCLPEERAPKPSPCGCQHPQCSPQGIGVGMSTPRGASAPKTIPAPAPAPQTCSSTAQISPLTTLYRFPHFLHHGMGSLEARLAPSYCVQTPGNREQGQRGVLSTTAVRKPPLLP